MIQELIYTSSPQGLKPGSRGFCTVAMTPNLPRNVVERLESLSGYRHLFAAGDEQAKLNPVAYSHVRLTVAGKRYHVLSRVADAGLDYTQRSNKLAHHLVFEAGDEVAAGPGAVLAQAGVMQTAWSGEARLLEARPKLPAVADGSGPCQAWQQIGGDAGWAGALAATAAGDRAAVVIYPGGTNALQLLNEALRLLPTAMRWNVTFNTYFNKLAPGIECRWRFIVADTPEAKTARGDRQALVIDLTKPLAKPPETALTAYARTGVRSPAVDKQLAESRAVAPRHDSVADLEYLPVVEKPRKTTTVRPVPMAEFDDWENYSKRPATRFKVSKPAIIGMGIGAACCVLLFVLFITHKPSRRAEARVEESNAVIHVQPDPAAQARSRESEPFTSEQTDPKADDGSVKQAGEKPQKNQDDLTSIDGASATSSERAKQADLAAKPRPVNVVIPDLASVGDIDLPEVTGKGPAIDIGKMPKPEVLDIKLWGHPFEGRLSYEMKPESPPTIGNQSWEVRVDSLMAGNKKRATFYVDGNVLRFVWSADIEQVMSGSPERVSDIKNYLLEVNSAAGQYYIALRKPITESRELVDLWSQGIQAEDFLFPADAVPEYLTVTVEGLNVNAAGKPSPPESKDPIKAETSAGEVRGFRHQLFRLDRLDEIHKDLKPFNVKIKTELVKAKSDQKGRFVRVTISCENIDDREQRVQKRIGDRRNGKAGTPGSDAPSDEVSEDPAAKFREWWAKQQKIGTLSPEADQQFEKKIKEYQEEIRYLGEDIKEARKSQDPKQEGDLARVNRDLQADLEKLKKYREILQVGIKLRQRMANIQLKVSFSLQPRSEAERPLFLAHYTLNTRNPESVDKGKSREPGEDKERPRSNRQNPKDAPKEVMAENNREKKAEKKPESKPEGEADMKPEKKPDKKRDKKRDKKPDQKTENKSDKDVKDMAGGKDQERVDKKAADKPSS